MIAQLVQKNQLIIVCNDGDDELRWSWRLWRRIRWRLIMVMTMIVMVMTMIVMTMIDDDDDDDDDGKKWMLSRKMMITEIFFNFHLNK